MKSKKARKYIDFHPIAFPKIVGMPEAIRAVEIAEQEAEERMREMAIKAHRACCPLNELQCIHRDRDDYNCTHECRYVISFIQKLNEE